MEKIAAIITAVCAVVALPISIWAIVCSKKASKEINIIKNRYDGPNVNIGSANNNGTVYADNRKNNSVEF